MTTNRPSDRRENRPGDASPPPGDAHAEHDTLLIARLAGNDVSGRDEARARAMVASCADCAALLGDLLAIAAALPEALPVVPRRRDFQLTVQDAAQLRGSRLTRWLDRARQQRLLLLQPLAGATVALGLAMALASAPGALPAGFAARDATAPQPPSVAATGLNVAGAPAEAAGGVQKGSGQGPAPASSVLPPASGLPSPTAAPAAGQPGPEASPPMLALPSPGAGGDQGTVAAGPPGETPAAGAGGGPAVAPSGAPEVSAPPEPAGGGPAAGGEQGAVALETRPTPGARAGVQVPGSTEVAGTAAATARSSGAVVETWELWLLVAAAGAVVLVAVTVATRRRTRAT